LVILPRKVARRPRRVADLFDGDLHEADGVDRVHPGDRLQVELILAASVLVENLVERDLHGGEVGLDLFQQLLGLTQALVGEPHLHAEERCEARVGRSRLVDRTEDVELAFRPEDRGVALCRGSIEDSRKDLPRRLERLPAGGEHVAEDMPGVGRPGQLPKAAQVGHDDPVAEIDLLAEAGVLGEVLPGVDREKRERPGMAALDRPAEEAVRRHHLGAGDSIEVVRHDPDLFDPGALDLPLDLAGEVSVPEVKVGLRLQCFRPSDRRISAVDDEHGFVLGLVDPQRSPPRIRPEEPSRRLRSLF